MSFVRKKLLETTRRVRSTFSNARVYAPIYFRAALEGLALGGGGGPGGEYDSSSSSSEDDADDCSGVGGSSKSNKEHVDQDAVLDLLWQYVVNDSVATLRGACARVFADRGGSSGDTRGAGLAFVKTPPSPSLVKYQRAEAVRILARELIAASAEAGERRKKSK